MVCIFLQLPCYPPISALGCDLFVFSGLEMLPCLPDPPQSEITIGFVFLMGRAEEYRMRLPIGLTCRSNEMEIIHACVTQITPYKENGNIFHFNFHHVVSHCCS